MSTPIILPNSKKGLKILMAVLFVLCLGASVAVYAFWSADQASINENGQPDFNTLKQDELKDGLIVKGDIDIVLDAYAEEYEETLGIRTDDDSETLYYLVPVYHEDDQGYITFDYLLTYEAGSEDFETMDTIIDNTWNGDMGAAVLNVDNARIRSLPSDIKGYLSEFCQSPDYYDGGTFIDWCVETGVFGTDDTDVIASKIVPYMIDKTAVAGTDLTIAWLFVGLAVLCLIIFLVLTLRKPPVKEAADNTTHTVEQ